MALTIAIDNDTYQIMGHQRMVTGTITFDSAYPAGGEALTAANLGLALINDIEFMSKGGYVFYTDTAMPATSINVEILCPTGGSAPTTVAAPSALVTAGDTAITSGTLATAAGVTITGGRGVEFGAGDASSLVPHFRCFGI